MKRRLYLMRHAKSDWNDPTLHDAERPLNRRGRQASEKIASYISEHGIKPQLVLCSAALRTRQTLELIESALPSDAQISIEDDIYSFDADQVLDRIRRVSDDVSQLMVIGHSPAMGALAVGLSGPSRLRDEIAEGFPTAAIASLETSDVSWRELSAGDATVVAFVRPSDLP